MKRAKFTIQLIQPNPHRADTMAWRAGQLATAMVGCSVNSIIKALTALERDTDNTGVGDPARWLTHFAGLESKASGKGIEAWLEIVSGDNVVATLQEFKELITR